MARLVAVLVTVLGLAGCTVPDIGGNRFRCSGAGECGEGWVCAMAAGGATGACQPAGTALGGGTDGAGASSDTGALPQGRCQALRNRCDFSGLTRRCRRRGSRRPCS